MSWLCSALRERVQILIPRQIPNDDNGSLDLLFGNSMGESFEFGPFSNLVPVKTIWAGFKPITFKGAGAQYDGGKQINEAVTHRFKVRRVAVDELGKQFGLSFSSSFKFMADLMGLKSNYFLFVERSSTVKGRLFRIHNITDHKENREYLNVDAEEIEERGSGYGI